MYLSSLHLKNFRSYKEKSLSFSEPVTLIEGPNASGKTNLLEAISLLAVGKSFRATKDEEMIGFHEEFSRVSGVVDGDSLEIVLTHGDWQGKKVAKKRYLVNGTAKRRKDFIGNLKVVLFEPENIELVIGGPGAKRNYIDFVLSQIDWEYDQSLTSYQKGMRQRNRLLATIAEGRAGVTQLEFWNRLLVKHGEMIRMKREAYLDYLNSIITSSMLAELFHLSDKDHIHDFEIEYQPSAITLERLEKHREAELATATTLVGPHRDTFDLFQKEGTEKKNLAMFGSRGEQRIGVLAMKLGELEYVSEKTGERPLLLLDDIFSELDPRHQAVVLTAVGNQQTIITTANTDAVPSLPGSKITSLHLASS